MEPRLTGMHDSKGRGEHPPPSRAAITTTCTTPTQCCLPSGVDFTPKTGVAQEALAPRTYAVVLTGAVKPDGACPAAHDCMLAPLYV